MSHRPAILTSFTTCVLKLLACRFVLCIASVQPLSEESFWKRTIVTISAADKPRSTSVARIYRDLQRWPECGRVGWRSCTVGSASSSLGWVKISGKGRGGESTGRAVGEIVDARRFQPNWCQLELRYKGVMCPDCGCWMVISLLQEHLIP